MMNRPLTWFNVALLVAAGSTLMGARPVEGEAASIVAKPEPVMVSSVPAYHPPAVHLGDSAEYSPPDFAAFRDVSARKRAFFDYLLPKIYAANDEVMRERAWLKALAEQLVAGVVITDQQAQDLAQMEARYALAGSETGLASRISELMHRVDTVPASLILAQAAKESGWGTSRFAREGNNYFGIWCFYEGCGMTPLRRSPGLTHEVAMFDTVAEGVRYYIRTINTHVAYSDLRKMRLEARHQNASLTGDELANGLLRYSERGLAYVREIQSMIRYNQLHRFTRTGRHTDQA